MAENLKRRPKKSILKNSSSFDQQEQQKNAKKQKETKWDEMNIIATLHPPDKDYGHMKIQEPKTPFNYMEQDNIEELDASDLAERIRIAGEEEQTPKALQVDESDDDSEEELTEEQKKKKKEFELKRKKHYNEFHALQLAKKLLEEEEEDDDDLQEQSTSSTAHTQSKSLNKKK